MKSIDFHTSIYGRLVYFTLVIFCVLNSLFLRVAYLEHLKFSIGLQLVILIVGILNLLLLVYSFLQLLKLSPRFTVNEKYFYLHGWIIKRKIFIESIVSVDPLRPWWSVFQIRPLAMSFVLLKYIELNTGVMKKILVETTGIKPDENILIGEISHRLSILKYRKVQ
jgi:hypothetical protein